MKTKEKTRAEKLRFQVEFMRLMLLSGRVKMAFEALDKAENLTTELIEGGQ